MSDFGTFLGKIAGKVVNAANGSQELMCLGKCDKITNHISISYADMFLSSDGQGKGEETFNAIFGTVYSLFQNNEVHFFLPPASCLLPQSDNLCTSLI